MEASEVSLHQLKVYQIIRQTDGWTTASEVIKKIEGVASRTVRAHIFKMVKIGILDQAEVFPEHRYRLSKFADKRNKAYSQRLEQAAEVFGLKLK